MPQSFNASLNVQLNAASLNASTKQISNALGRITGQASEFQKSLDASTARVFAFGATTVVLNGVTQSFKKLLSTTVDVQKRLIEINSIFQASEASFNRFRNSIFAVAKETGQAFETVADGAAELARQGLSAAETANRLKSALVLTRISGLDAEKSVKALTAAINGFQSAGLQHNEIVNKMVAVDTAFAVSAQDLAEAFSRAGSTAEDAGVSFDQLLGLVTAVEQKTARGGAVIGNAFKSIFTRLARGSTIDKLQELGVEIDATQSGIQKLEALSNAIENIADPTVVSKIKELAGGVFQINVVSAALKDLSNDTSIFAGATEKSVNASNEAFEKNEALNKSLATSINTLIVGLTSLAEKIGSITLGPLAESLLGIANKFVTFLDKALDPEKGNALIKGFFKAIGAFLSGPALVIFTVAFVKITKLVAKFAAEGVRTLLTMGSQTEKIRQIENGLVGLLGRDVALRKTIESTTMSQAQKEQAVITAIQRENALLQQQAVLMRQLAAAAAARGVTGFTSGGGFSGRRGAGFSAGFRAEEAQAQMLGASPSVKAHRSKGTIGGRRFIMNNEETEIPNFAGGDSAVIPRYARGFVPNYVRIPSVADIERKRRSDFFTGDKARSEWIDAEIAKGSAVGLALQKKRDSQGKRSYYANEGSNKTVMVIPDVYKFNPNRADHKFLKPYRSGMGQGMIDFFEGGVTGIAANLEGNKKFGKLVGLEKHIKQNLTDAVNASLNGLVDKSNMRTNPRSYSKSDVVDIMEKGGAGAFGAIKGAVFEALIQAITGGVAQDKGQLDIDFSKDDGNILDLIFGISGFSYGDFKASRSRDNKTKFAKQTIDNVRGKVGTARTRKKTKNDTNRAAGFIPNFNAVLGYPVKDDQIRIHRDSMGEPLAVTNTRDEPRGLRDAIDRERAGVGMASRGFVPNYAAGAVVGRLLSKVNPKNLFGGFKKGADKSAKAMDKQAKAAGSSGTGMLAISIASGGVVTALGGVESGYQQQVSAFKALQEAQVEAAIATAKVSDKFMKAGQIIDESTGKFKDGLFDLVDTIHEQTLKEGPQRTGMQKAANTLSSPLVSAGLMTAAMFAPAGVNKLKGMKGKAPAAGAGSNAARFQGVPTTSRATHFSSKAAASTLAATKATTKLGKAFDKTKNVLGKVVSKAAIPLTIAFGALEIASIRNNDELSKTEKANKTRRAVGSTAGAAIGAAAGTLIPIPVVGTLVGAAVGSFIGGGIAGLFDKPDTDAEKTQIAESRAATIQDQRNKTLKELGFDQLVGDKEMGFGGAENMQDVFNKMFADAGGTLDQAQEIVDMEQNIEGYSRALDAAKKAVEDAGNNDKKRAEALEEQVTAENLLKGAQSKYRLGIAKAVKLIDAQNGAAKRTVDRNMKIAAATAKVASAEAKLAEATLRLSVQRNAAADMASNIDRQATVRADLGQLIDSPVGKAGLAQRNMFAGINSASLKKFSAEQNLKEAEHQFEKTTGVNPILMEGIMEKFRKDPTTLDEQEQRAVDEFTKEGAALPKAMELFEKAGHSFEDSVRAAYIGFEKAAKDAAAAQKEVKTQMDDLIQSSIRASGDSLRNLYGADRDPIDMDFMGEQVQQTVDEIQKMIQGDKAFDPEELGHLFAEFDDQGLGVKLEDLIREFDPSILTDELVAAMQEARNAAFGGAETLAGKKMQNIIQPDFEKREGIDITEPMKKLEGKLSEFDQIIEMSNTNLLKLFTDERTSAIATELDNTVNAYQNMAEGANGMAELFIGEGGAGEEANQVKTFIEESNKLFGEMIGAVKDASKALKAAKAELADAKGS